MTDKDIVQGLIDRDERLTRQFFFNDCRPLFQSVIRFVFSYPVEYDEFVNELYQYLMANDAERLRNFQYRSSIYQWLKILAIRYFIRKRDQLIENQSREPLYVEGGEEFSDQTEARMELENLLSQVSNPRYVFVIRKLVIEDMEPETLAAQMGITTANLYNIKKRAIAALTKIAINNNKKYGR